MKHYVQPECKHKCRFVQVTDELWLCPHASYGATSYLTGAVEAARALLEKAGGYEAVLARIENKDEERRAAARAKRNSKQHRLAESVKYK